MLRNYLPPVILSCAFQAFVNPFIYFLCTYNISDLSDVIKVFGYSFEAKDIVLPDMMYSIILIWGDFLLLLTYGVISPYIAFFIGVNICSQICLLKASICRYYYLQFNNIDDKSSIPRNDVHLENIVEHCIKNIHAIIWPGLVISSIVFSLYLFDMAYDTTNRPSGEHWLCL